MEIRSGGVDPTKEYPIGGADFERRVEAGFSMGVFLHRDLLRPAQSRNVQGIGRIAVMVQRQIRHGARGRRRVYVERGWPRGQKPFFRKLRHVESRVDRTVQSAHA